MEFDRKPIFAFPSELLKNVIPKINLTIDSVVFSTTDKKEDEFSIKIFSYICIIHTSSLIEKMIPPAIIYKNYQLTESMSQFDSIDYCSIICVYMSNTIKNNY